MENEEIINHEKYTTKGIDLYKISFTALHNKQYDTYLKSFKKMIDIFEISIRSYIIVSHILFLKFYSIV